MELSIIIPVYNVEKYIRRNLKSMMQQSNPDIEFIYVDDGSPDNCASIIEEAMENDTRIRLIRQSNKGLSGARNTGIRNATGKFVMFIDGDDYVVSEMSAIIPIVMSKYGLDVLRAGVYIVDEDETVEEVCFNDKQINVISGMKAFLKREWYINACNYIYDREFIINNSLWFIEGILHEDMEYVPRVLYCADRMAHIDYKTYIQVHRQGSITSTPNLKRSHDMIAVAYHLKKYAEENNIIVKEWSDYIRMVYQQAIHVGVANGYDIDDIVADYDTRKIIIGTFNNGNLKQKIIGLIMTFKLDKIYALLYRSIRR